MKLSLIIPFYNEEQSLPQLLNDLKDFSKKFPNPHEIIFVNDGSTDSSLELVQCSPFKIISHTQNAGQGASWRTGISASQGEYLVFLDSDLQFDLCDIDSMYHMIERGESVVWGWRKKRQDPWLSVTASIIGNTLIRTIFSTKAHDCGCSLKIIRKDLLLNLPDFKNVHRYFPVFLKNVPRQSEYVVHHRPRFKGQSKYSLFKVFDVLKELIKLKLIGY